MPAETKPSRLLDCGDYWSGERFATPVLPSDRRRPGEWVARYVKRVNPRGDQVDYLLLSHFHRDHCGCYTYHAGMTSASIDQSVAISPAGRLTYYAPSDLKLLHTYYATQIVPKGTIQYRGSFYVEEGDDYTFAGGYDSEADGPDIHHPLKEINAD